MSGTGVTPLGLASLFTLVLQNTALVLLMRLAVTSGTGFLASTAVVCDEAMKLTLCAVVMIMYYVMKVPTTYMMPLPNHSPPRKSFRGLLRFLRRECFGQSAVDILKMSVPALCYTVQKNCLFLALRHLEAAVYQVTYQAKILTTALFSCALLGKPMSYKQVMALCVLAVGVAVIQEDGLAEKQRASAVEQRPIVGLLAVAVACMTSGFAGTFFELQLKTPSFSHSSCSQELAKEFSMWVRNMHLAMFALSIGLVGSFYKDGAIILERGFLQGYTPLTWLVIFLEAAGGIVVALVIKYTDNILKNFATAISIVTSTAVSSWAMNFAVTPTFTVGTVLVLLAVPMYQRNPPSKSDTCPIGRCRSGQRLEM
jgi:UDP-galactose transporter